MMQVENTDLREEDGKEWKSLRIKKEIRVRTVQPSQFSDDEPVPILFFFSF